MHLFLTVYIYISNSSTCVFLNLHHHFSIKPNNIWFLFFRHERASRIDPTNFRHQWRKGDLHTRRGEFAAAKSSFKQALTLDPSNVKVLYSIGKMYSDQGRYGSAVEVLEKVAAVAPSSLKTARLLAGVYRKIGRTERAEELEKRINDTIKSGQ